MKKSIFYLPFLALLLSCSDEFQKDNNNTENGIKHETGFQTSLNLEESFTATRSSENHFIYPNYYSGGYISDNDELVILVTKGFKTDKIKQEFQTRSKSSNIILKECNYSFNELSALNDSLSNIYCNNPDLVNKLGWISVGITPESNRVSVYLRDCSDKFIQEFKSEISNSQMIEFEEMDYLDYDVKLEEIADSIVSKAKATVPKNVHAGSLISRIGKATHEGKIVNAILQGSVGFRAMIGNTHGFITAAHCAPEVNMKFNFQKTKDSLGIVSKTAISQKVDAAFVSVNYNSFYPTNVTQWSKIVYQSQCIPIKSITNQIMIIEGQETQKSIKVKVKSTTFSATAVGFSSTGEYYKFPITGAISAEYVSSNDTTKNGDSGGIVYSDTKHLLGGIHTARGRMKNGTSIEVFTSAEQLLKALGATSVWKK